MSYIATPKNFNIQSVGNLPSSPSSGETSIIVALLRQKEGMHAVIPPHDLDGTGMQLVSWTEEPSGYIHLELVPYGYDKFSDGKPIPPHAQPPDKFITDTEGIPW